MRIIITALLSVCTVFSIWSQNTVTGTFKDLANQQIQLVGYNGFDTYSIDNTQANDKGEFSYHKSIYRS